MSLLKPARPLSAGLAALCIATSACSSAGKNPAAPEAGKPAAAPSAASHASGPHAALPRPLTQEEAAIRARQIGRPTYVLWFGLDDEREDFEGRVVINFELLPGARDYSKEVFVDFLKGTITALSINGVSVSESGIRDAYDGNRIHLKVSELRSGSNRLEVAFSHAYSKSGSGFYRFKDPEDGKVYLYTDHEPYSAHQTFPCFDQPDLKGTFELTVEAPEDWEVIANTEERETGMVDGRKSWMFPPSPVFSTYLFALHAGSYAKWSADADGVPIRLFARRSLARYVDAQEWLTITRDGLRWYGKFFEYAYPFSKYDQVIVPDYNAGAMENVAAVTFSERFVNRSKTTQDRLRDRAGVILHEMAHMWFGDLVTMKWWNGLWLNESFATFMGNWAVDESTKYKGTWQAFAEGAKGSAYREDQQVTTHPIEGPVPDTDKGFTQFDGITYGKGASVLKQLAYLLGTDSFKKGLQHYFKTYAFRNTTIDEFIGSLSLASGRELTDWKRMWLETSGVNTVAARWSCKDGKVDNFVLQQRPSSPDAVLRPHKAQVAFYAADGARLKLKDTLDVSYSGAETPVPNAVGRPCPELVYPNHADHDYAKVELDPASLRALREKLSGIADPLARTMAWASLWEMLRDAKLPPQEYLEAALAHLPKEENTLVLSITLSRAISPRSQETALHYLDPSLRAPFLARFEAMAREGLRQARPGSDTQLVWFGTYLQAARSAEALADLRALLDGKRRIPGLKIEQDRRWELIQALARNNAAGNLTEAELKRDPSDTGRKESIFAEASVPTPENKRKWMETIVQGKLKVGMARYAMSAFHQLEQEDSGLADLKAYLDGLKQVEARGEEVYGSRYARAMLPMLCERAQADAIGEFLAANPALVAYAVKALRIGRQETERCVSARELSRSSSATPAAAPPAAGAP